MAGSIPANKGGGQEPPETAYLPFDSKLVLVREVLGEKVPRVAEAPRGPTLSSLLCSTPSVAESVALPLSVGARSSLSVAKFYMDRELHRNPLGNVEGFTLSSTRLGKAKGFYKVASSDFALEQPKLGDFLQGELGSTQIIGVSPRLSKSLEEHLRLAIAANSLSEWLLATVSSLLDGAREAVAATTEGDLDRLKGDLGTSLATVSDLLSSVGSGLLDSTQATALALGELSVARRDSVVKKLNHVSKGLKEKLRVLPIVEEKEPSSPSSMADSLLPNLQALVSEDRERESVKRTQDLVFRACMESTRSSGHKRRSAPPDSQVVKRPRVDQGGARRGGGKESVSFFPQPFRGAPEHRGSYRGRSSRGRGRSFSRGRRGRSSGHF